MSDQASTDLLTLHTVRVLGYADTARVAARLDLPWHETSEHLLDAQARGWVTCSSFAGESGWSLTETGKEHGERLLADELDLTGGRPAVEAVYQEFLPLNEVVAAACTAWQLAEMGLAEQAVTFAETRARLTEPATVLIDIERRLTVHLDRFTGYQHRFAHALAQAGRDRGWITATDRDSCHRVWFELHEDLIATLGLQR